MAFSDPPPSCSALSPDASFPQLSFVCPKLWNEMRGDERTRFCDVCGRHVHNLSMLTADERASLQHNSAGRLCGTFQRRLDGSYVTPEKPLTEQERAKMRQVGAIALSAAALTLLAGCVTQPEVIPPAPTTTSDTSATPADEDEEVVLLAMGMMCGPVEAPYLTTHKIANRHRQ